MHGVCFEPPWSGNSLVFFPEGTFDEKPGLGKFHAGAFTIAARAGCPVVPAVVRGTRRAFPPKSAWPYPVRIEIEILEPIVAAAESTEAAALELRDKARLAILGELREPGSRESTPTIRRAAGLHVPSVLPTHLIKRMRDLPQRAGLHALHQLAEYVPA